MLITQKEKDGWENSVHETGEGEPTKSTCEEFENSRGTDLGTSGGGPSSKSLNRFKD